MVTKIERPIVAWAAIPAGTMPGTPKLAGTQKLAREGGEAGAAPAARTGPEVMSEAVQRPPRLEGRTYKIKTPLSEHALYVTINDIVLNPGTNDAVRRPFEIFLNSKSMEHFQWMVALTRIISAVFRKGGDVTFMVEELRSVFDPRGGYLAPGGCYVPSLVAEIGDVIDAHLRDLSLLSAPPDGVPRSEAAGVEGGEQAPVAD